MASESRPYDLATAEHDYPDWFGPPRRTILICTHPRSGSTLLGEGVYFAGDLGCPLEYFHVGCRPRFEARWGVHRFDEFARAMWRYRTAPNGVLAVKLMWRDVQELALEADPIGFADLETAPPDQVSPGIYRSLAELLEGLLPSPSWVHLYRKDRLRQAVSAMVATQTGQWRAIPGAEMTRVREPEYDDAMIVRQIGYSDFCHGHWRNLFAAIEQRPLSIAYEDLVLDYAGQVRDLLTALGSTAPAPPIRMQRQAGTLSEGFVVRYLQERGIPVAG